MVYNNDDITFFSVYQRLQSSRVIMCLQPSSLCGSGCNALSHSGFANVDKWKRMFYPLIEYGCLMTCYIYRRMSTVIPEVPMTRSDETDSDLFTLHFVSPNPYLKIEITILRLYRVMKNISLV